MEFALLLENSVLIVWGNEQAGHAKLSEIEAYQDGQSQDSRPRSRDSLRPRHVKTD